MGLWLDCEIPLLAANDFAYRSIDLYLNNDEHYVYCCYKIVTAACIVDYAVLRLDNDCRNLHDFDDSLDFLHCFLCVRKTCQTYQTYQTYRTYRTYQNSQNHSKYSKRLNNWKRNCCFQHSQFFNVNSNTYQKRSMSQNSLNIN